MQLRGKKYCDYEHQMALEIPEWMVERAVATFDELVDTELRTDPLITPQNKLKFRWSLMPRRTSGKGQLTREMPIPYLKVVK